MERFFTKFLLTVLVFGYVAVNAQKNNTFTITAPDAIKGDYKLERFSWGPSPATPIAGDAILVTDLVAPFPDGCDSISTNLTGKIAFIDRGTCGISDKSVNAQKKGAIAVIICNTATGSAAGVVAAGATAGTLKIPSYMMSNADCVKIRTQLTNNEIKGTLKNITCTTNITYPANTIWGKNPKEGDFNGGLNDWTVSNPNTWEWASEGEMLRGTFGGVVMKSLSACNGVAEFNSDYLDNSGLCPEPCSGSLISPSITIPPGVKGLAIEFSQAVRHFQGSVYRLVLSKDGGVTWPDTINLNNGLYGNDAAAESIRERVALPAAYTTLPKLRFRFDHVGAYYFWGIDDVIVLDQAPYNDVEVRQNFYAVAPSFKTPISQAQEIPLLADLGNKGNVNAQNVILTATMKSGTTVLQQETNNYNVVPAYGSNENKVFPKTMTQPTTAGVYNIEYKVNSTGDIDSTNNKQDFNFVMTPSTFGKIPTELENGSNYLGFVYNNLTFWRDVKHYSIGNAFYVKNSKNSSGSALLLAKVRFGIGNTIASVANSVIKIDVYEFLDKNGDGDVTDASEKKKVGTNVVFLTSDITTPRRIEADVFVPEADGSISDKKLRVKSETLYLVVLHTEPAAASTPQIQILGYDPRTLNTIGRDYYYGATNLAYDSLGLLRSASSFGGKGDSPDDNDTREIFRVDFKTAFIEMDLALASSTYDIATSGEATLFPNPASSELYIDLSLHQVSKNVRVDLMSIDGRTVTSASFQQVQESRLRLDLTDIVSGTYNALIHTDQGVITRKVVIQK
ncbi:MAG: T9SS type A sorting domain-containing protein [Saprospiraceae bacterium]|jgi:hypothetical protein|nr:T9SS type A sorting domain-containing protein [Saprospiraceae bacterium]